MEFIMIIVIAISLSLDAFSLALAYGMISLKKREIIVLSTIVGMYHFFMPVFGMLIGKILISLLNINADLIIFLIFSFIGIQMIFENLKKEKEPKKLKVIEMFLFGFAVSIDSFSVGIGIQSISSNILLCSFTFSFTSFVFTYFGLSVGNKLHLLIGKISTVIGGLVLIVLGFLYLI